MASVAATRARVAPRMGKQARREERWFYLLISPWLLGYVLFIAGPTVASFVLSFTHDDPVRWPPTWAGLANYDLMLHDDLFWQSLKVTFSYTAVSVPLSVVTATAVALMLNQGLPLLSMWRTIYYLPAVASGVAVAIMWQWIFQPSFGLLNGTLYSLTGIEGPRWLIDEHWAMPALVIISMWQFGGPMLIYLAAIQGVPTTLYESAEIDGANLLQRAWHITIPSITPVIFFNLIMHVTAAFQTFTNAYVVTRGGPHYATYFFVLNVYNNAFAPISNMGYADALSWVLFVIVLMVTLLGFKTARFWVYYENPGEQADR